MREKFWGRSVAVLLTIGTVGALVAGCGTKAVSAPTTGTSTSTPVEGGSIVLDATSNIKDLDPAVAIDAPSYEAVLNMYDQLVTFEKSSSKIIPDIAERWEVSPDGKTYTFHLRKGVQFWNGDPCTAQSFVDEFHRALSPKLAAPMEGFLDPIIAGSTAYHQGKSRTISGITAPDDQTLVIHLTQPEPFFLQILTMPIASAVDQKHIDAVGNTSFDTLKPMGTGPFELSQFTTDQMVLTKNPHYWRRDDSGNPLPYLDKVTMRINKDGQLDALNFERGTTAFMGRLIGIPSSNYPQFMNNPTLRQTIVQAPQNTVYYLGLNNHIAPFNNVKVRQAVEYAINKDQIVKLMNHRVLAADQPLPPGVDGHMANLPDDIQYHYDPTKAKELLKEANKPNGFSTTLYSSNDPDTLKIDEAIQNDLAQVGIKATIQSMNWGSIVSLTSSGKTGMFRLDFKQDYPDASDFLNYSFNSTQAPQINCTVYNNPQVDTWLNKAQTDTNQAERLSLYNKVTVQVMQDAPWVPLYYDKAIYAVQSWVHGFAISPTPMMPDPLQYIWIDKGHSQS